MCMRADLTGYIFTLTSYKINRYCVVDFDGQFVGILKGSKGARIVLEKF